MRVSYLDHTIFLSVLFLSIGLTGIADVRAIAQVTETSRQLDRVEVEALEMRPSARGTSAPGSGLDYDQPTPSGFPSPEDLAGPTQAFSGSGISAATLSLVEGKSVVSLNAASLPAQVQVVTSQDIQRLVVRDVSDLFRKVPGINSNWYGQGDVGFGFGMRGFVGQHGKDTATFVDGVPQNFPSASQGSTGMTNLAWLTPEVIERIEIIKGPVSALYGDFALAGVVNIVTKKSEASPSLSASGGSFGYARGLGVLSSETWSPTPYLANEVYTIDGYRDNSQQRKWNTFNKISSSLWGGLFCLRFNYSTSDWGGPAYLSIAQVKKGLVGRKHAVDMTDGGDQTRYGVVMNYAPLSGERGLYATLYWDRYSLTRFGSNTKPQLAQVDDRQSWGGRIYYNLVFCDRADLTAGVESRQDSGKALQYNSVERQRYNTRYDYELGLSSYSWFVQGQVKPVDGLKIVGGVRGDYFREDVVNTTKPVNSGTGYPQAISPKIGLVITPTKNFNIFGNVANGLRSPASVELSPTSTAGNKDFSLPPSGVTTSDVGFNATLFGNLFIAADYYHTIMQKEVQTINNQQVAIGDTTRKGFEAEATFYPAENMSVFANYAWVDAKVQNPVNTGQYFVQLVPEHIIKGGIQFTRDFGSATRILADAYYQYYSGVPLYLTSSAVTPTYGPDYDVYNFKLTYMGRGWSAFAAGKYQPREFSSQFIGPFSGTLNFDPQPKWTFTSELTYTF